MTVECGSANRGEGTGDRTDCALEQWEGFTNRWIEAGQHREIEEASKRYIAVVGHDDTVARYAQFKLQGRSTIESGIFDVNGAGTGPWSKYAAGLESYISDEASSFQNTTIFTTAPAGDRSVDDERSAKKCEAKAGLIEEAEEMMGEEADPEVMDAVIIALAQKVEHDEIATYGTLWSWASSLNYVAKHVKGTIGLLPDGLCGQREKRMADSAGLNF